MTKLDQIRDFLAKQGFRPQVRDDYVLFKYEGGTFLLPFDEEDPNFFRIVYPNFFPFASAGERQRVLETAAVVTGMVKGVKVFPGVNDTIASIELLLPDEATFQQFFPRALLSLQEAVRRFVMAMRNVDAEDPVAEAIRLLFRDRRDFDTDPDHRAAG
ncbi:MAG: hypothetical protein AB7I19_05535 [Planctomycetota bacterium]